MRHDNNVAPKKDYSDKLYFKWYGCIHHMGDRVCIFTQKEGGTKEERPKVYLTRMFLLKWALLQLRPYIGDIMFETLMNRLQEI